MGDITLTQEAIDEFTKPYREKTKPFSFSAKVMLVVMPIVWATLFIWCGVFDAPSFVQNVVSFLYLILMTIAVIVNAIVIIGVNSSASSEQKDTFYNILFNGRSPYYYSKRRVAYITTAMVVNLLILVGIGWFFTAVIHLTASLAGIVHVFFIRSLAKEELQRIADERIIEGGEDGFTINTAK